MTFLLLAALLVLPACNNAVGPTNSVVDIYAHIRQSWSPTGNLIAYSSVVLNLTGIYTIDTLGGNSHQILSGDGTGLTWSPDGKWLAFSRGGLLYKMKSSGDSLTQLILLLVLFVQRRRRAAKNCFCPNCTWQRHLDL